ncbi:hypothetical protein PR048_025589 [Dryococelus australis]|uniref:TTF-type domain-containing protein n=1 Tax=Dryococelus australis TaxID=614101 RepID=A0ABQ9GRT2_9NEOP|nr:hypothetical protein PR048_025589 [Dryococelus australis]
MRQILVERGPSQVMEMNFSADNKGKKFTPANYRRKLTNGEEIQREWLAYSIRQNSIFCYCCKLFSNEKISVTSASGFLNWRNMSGFLSHHEKSPVHIKVFHSWWELSQQLFSGKTADEEHQSMVQFLETQGLTFRGTTENLFKKDNGNLST